MHKLWCTQRLFQGDTGLSSSMTIQFGLVKWDINLCMLFNAKAIHVEEKLWYYSTVGVIIYFWTNTIGKGKNPIIRLAKS